MTALLQTSIPGYPCRQGKVRDIYDLGDKLVLVATDRISAFDYVLPNGIPDKGRVLTALTVFWLNFLETPNHLISTNVDDLPDEFKNHRAKLEGRVMLVHKVKVIPVECVCRGYLAGSGWKEYQHNGMVCGIQLPAGLQESQQLPQTIFTPATKEESGHDQNISYEDMCRIVKRGTAYQLRRKSVSIYEKAAQHAKEKGIIIADTKFEWGLLPNGDILLIDEVLTPDSSRFWPADQYQVGGSPVSFDKQFVRNWLETSGWDKNSTPPELPDHVVARTREKYLEAYQRLTGQSL